MFEFCNGDFKFQCNIDTSVWNIILIVRDSLLETFEMHQVDTIGIPGVRSDDLDAFIDGYRFASLIRHYNEDILFLGGNGVNGSPKKYVLRRAERPRDFIFIWNNTMNRIKYLNPRCKVAIVGVPLRMNGTA